VIMEMLVEVPVILPKMKSLLALPNTSRIHPFNNKLVVVACRLSGNAWKRDQFRKKTTTDIILASWRKGTKKQYSSYLQKWVSYCSKKKISTVHVSVGQELFENGLGYSTINTARSSLSAVGIKCDGITIGSHPIVIRHLKGIFNLRPSVPRYS